MFRSSTQFSIALFRTQLFGADDMPNVTKNPGGLQGPAALRLPQAKTSARCRDWIRQRRTPSSRKTNFFEYLDFVLALAPPGPEEQGIRAKLAKMGVGPGKTFEFKDLSLEHKAAVLLGMKAGEKTVDEKVASVGKPINGWRVGAAFGDRAFL